MKFNKFIGFLCVAAFGAAAVSCSDDDPKWNDEGSKVDLPDSRVYILNEGTMAQNNAGIEFYNPSGVNDIISDIFYRQNSMSLGDVGQSMIEYNGYIYVSVYGSNYLSKLNSACVEEVRALFSDDADLRGGIRYIDAEDGYIYASFYGGVVAKIDARTLEVKAKLNTGGSNLEGVAIEGDNLYVANSYTKALDPETGKNKYIYHTDVFVIDLKSFSLKETLVVAQNPNQLVEEDGKVFLISWNYSAESYELQLINPAANNAVTKLGYATNMAVGDDILYIVDSRTDYSVRPYVTTNTFSSYDIRRGQMISISFLKDAPAELSTASVYMMAVDDKTGEIYIGTTNYSASNGDIYRFKRDGSFVEKFDCGGQNPKAAVFLH